MASVLSAIPTAESVMNMERVHTHNKGIVCSAHFLGVLFRKFYKRCSFVPEASAIHHPSCSLSCRSTVAGKEICSSTVCPEDLPYSLPSRRTLHQLGSCRQVSSSVQGDERMHQISRSFVQAPENGLDKITEVDTSMSAGTGKDPSHLQSSQPPQAPQDQ